MFGNTYRIITLTVYAGRVNISSLISFSDMAPRKGKQQQEQVQVSLGPQVKEGENVFGVAHIFASFNDTFVHVTDLSGRYGNSFLL